MSSESSPFQEKNSPVRWTAPAGVGLATLLLYLPALRNGFLWDDQFNFILNQNYRGLGWAQLRWMFTTSHLGAYQPAAWLTYALDYKFWGMDPFGYHLTNILIHAANALLFYFLSLRLLAPGQAMPEDRFGAAGAALLFAAHPLEVEPVAWVSARGHILCAFFFLLTLLCWLKAASPRRRFWSRLAFASCVLALLSKAMAITLPAVLVILNVYPLRKLPGDPRRWFSRRLRGVWRELLPFFAAALASALIEIMARHRDRTILSLSRLGPARRLAQSLFALGFYLEKTLVPTRLCPDFLLEPSSSSPIPFIIGGALLAAGLLAALRRNRAALALIAYYVITLLPVLSLVKVGHETVASRYAYLPCLGWALLAGAGLRSLARPRRSGGRGAKAFLPAFACAAAALVAFSWLSRRQIGVWHDSVALWRQVLKLDPLHPFARANLATGLLEESRVGEAALMLREQERLFPADKESGEKAKQIISRAWGSSRPDPAKLYNDAGADLVQAGELEKAVWCFNKALKLAPALARTRNNLGLALYRLGRTEEAIAQYEECLRLAPSSYEARTNLGIALARLGRLDEAIVRFQGALRLKPDYLPARESLRLARELKSRARLGPPPGAGPG